MEIFWAKITTILSGIYWGGQVESRIRWESQGACNNREADGSGPEQLEQSSPSAYPEFAVLPPEFLLYLYGAYFVRYMTYGGTACVLSWYFILAKNPHREALKPTKFSSALPSTSWEACTDCTGKITPLLGGAAALVGSSPGMCVWGSTTAASLEHNLLHSKLLWMAKEQIQTGQKVSGFRCYSPSSKMYLSSLIGAKPLHRETTAALMGKRKTQFCSLTAPAERWRVHMSIKEIQACTVVPQSHKEMTIAGEIRWKPQLLLLGSQEEVVEVYPGGLVPEDKSNKKQVWQLKKPKILYVL